MSFIRWSRSRKRVERGDRRVGPPRGPLRVGRSRRPGRPGVGQPVRPGDRRGQPVDDELVEDRFDVVRRRQDGVGDALERGEALDRDRPEAVVRASTLPRRRPAVTGSRPVEAAGAWRVASPIGIPSSAAHASSVAASGTTSVVPGIDAVEDLAGAAVDRDDVARLQRSARRSTTRPSRTSIAGRPDDRRDAPAAGDDRGMAGEAAAGRQDPGRPGHPVDVVGRGLGPDEDRRPARPRPTPAAASGSSTIGPLAMPGDAGSPVASGGRRRCADAGEPSAGGRGARRRARRPRARDSGNAVVLGHVDGDPERRLRAPLADPDLEHPEPAVLDRELDVAQVGVVALQPRRRSRAARRRPPAAARRGRRSARSDACPATTSSPWASNMTSP